MLTKCSLLLCVAPQIWLNTTEGILFSISCVCTPERRQFLISHVQLDWSVACYTTHKQTRRPDRFNLKHWKAVPSHFIQHNSKHSYLAVWGVGVSYCYALFIYTSLTYCGKGVRRICYANRFCSDDKNGKVMHTEIPCFCLFVICCVMFTLFSDHSSAASWFHMIIIRNRLWREDNSSSHQLQPIQLCVVFILDTGIMFTLRYIRSPPFRSPSSASDILSSLFYLLKTKASCVVVPF